MANGQQRTRLAALRWQWPYVRAKGAQAVLPSEGARAFSEVMTDHVSLQRTGWGAKWPGTLAHARAKANTRHTRGERGFPDLEKFGFC